MLWYGRGMSNEVVPGKVVQGHLLHRYTDIGIEEVTDPDVLNSQNNLRASQVRKYLQNSGILSIAIAQVESGRRVFLDYGLLAAGHSVQDSLIMSTDEMKDKDRIDLLKILLNKAFPNAKEAESSSDKDIQSEIVKWWEEEEKKREETEKKRNTIDADFDSNYQEEEAPSEDGGDPG